MSQNRISTLDFEKIHCDNKGLFNYQVEMKERLYATWNENLSVMCQMPTGTGKTYFFVSVVKDLVNTWDIPVWIIAHRIELISQISQTLTKYAIPHGQIISGERIKKNPVQVASIQTLANALQSSNVDLLPPSVIIIDEAHHSPANSYKLLWQHYPEAYKLGVTATPCRLKRHGFTGQFDKLLISWPVSRFIEEGRLALFDYLSILPTSEEQKQIDSLVKRGVDGDYSVQEMGVVLNRPSTIASLYKAYEHYALGKKGIVYAVNRAHAHAISSYYQSKGVRAVAIDGKTPSTARTEYVKKYIGGELDVIVNVDIFSEGFDCPDVEFIQLARPTLSLAKYLQQVGRGLRVHPSKKKTLILDQVGLYRLFGLPTESRDWQNCFIGKLAGKGKAAIERDTHLLRLDTNVATSGENSMVVVQGHEEFLRELTNRNAEPKPFTENGLVGLRKGDLILIQPKYKDISAFKESYAVFETVAGRYGILNKAGNILPLPSCGFIELLDNDFARVCETSLVSYYLDLKSFVRFPEKPEEYRVDFLTFVRYKDRYFLRSTQLTQTISGGFNFGQLHIEGDVFYQDGILIHRDMPYKIFSFDSYDKKGVMRVRDNSYNLYVCEQGKPPVQTGEKSLIYKYLKR